MSGSTGNGFAYSSSFFAVVLALALTPRHSHLNVGLKPLCLPDAGFDNFEGPSMPNIYKCYVIRWTENILKNYCQLPNVGFTSTIDIILCTSFSCTNKRH